MMVSPGDARSLPAKVDRAMRLLRRRLVRSKALRLAAVRSHDCGWDGLPGQCAGRRRPAA
jgi:hypothetical protein